MNLWSGRFEKQLDDVVHKFNSSIKFDKRMYKEDIKGSTIHAIMLEKQGIISAEDCEKIRLGLAEIFEKIENGSLEIDLNAEDIHMFIESELTKRIGDAGKRLHTARSRNDQVALDVRMHLKVVGDGIFELLENLVETLLIQAGKYDEVIMPGYTHLQRAQPITFGHHLMAYAQMFVRDMDRTASALKRMCEFSPLGSGALAGTTYDIDRHFTAQNLGFSAPCINSLDGVSDRDYMLELMGACSIIMMHLSRFSEEIILWCSWEFKFITLDDAFATGSSIMPQKKNPDIAELVRGKTGRVYGDLFSLLTVMKGLPLAYNKDMQEDKEAVFDAVDTVTDCLVAFTPMLETLSVNEKNMRKAASSGFINATDGADYLVKKGIPFRDAYTVIGKMVAYCIENDETLETLSIEKYREFSDAFDADVFDAIDLDNCLKRRTSYGGPSSVLTQTAMTKKQIFKLKRD